MKLTTHNGIGIRKIDYKKTANQLLLEEFLNSGEMCCEVTDYSQRDAYSAANSLKATAQRNGLSHRVTTRALRGRCYLLRLDKEEKDV